MASALAMGGIPACGDAGTHAAQQTGKPDDKKPAEGSKPDAAKPGDKKDGEKPKDDGKTRNGNELLDIEVGGKKFKLELAITPDVRMKGLGQRNQIEAEGGMLFVFKDSDVRVQKFVMRDCPVDIDIIYLDGAGRVTAMYQMKAEKPRAADGSEGKIGDINMDDPRARTTRSACRRIPADSTRST